MLKSICDRSMLMITPLYISLMVSLSLLASSNINKATVGPPEGFFLKQNAVSEETWKILKTWINTDLVDNEHAPIPWQIGAQNRQVAQFGFRYDYTKHVVDTTTPTVQIPPKLNELLHVDNSYAYTQCIINRYEPDILIPWHKDDLDFGPTVSVFTFGEARPLLLRLADDHKIAATPGHCSKYSLSESSRYEWEHMVPTGSEFRVFFTFRTHKNDP